MILLAGMSGYVGILVDNLCALHRQLVDNSATAFSLPGIGVELKITTSPGMIETFLCRSAAIRDSAARDSPWLPVVIRRILFSYQFFRCSMSISVFSGILMYPSSLAVPMTLTMLRLDHYLTSIVVCRIDDLLDTVYVGSKRRNDDPVVLVLCKKSDQRSCRRCAPTS